MNTICETAPAQRTIDFSCKFMPEELTPLFHTPAYALLSPREQLRYNQLNALYFNEQIMFFERALAGNTLSPFLGAGLPAKVERGLEQFLREEQEHSSLFLALNRSCAPHLYREREFHFIRPGPAAMAVISWMSRRPWLFPLFLWIAHLQEERSLYFGRTFLSSPTEIEPNFREVHRMHLADEARHVQWDGWLLDYVWPQTGRWRRTINSHLLGAIVREFFATPKRSTLNVIRQLVIELPELKDREAILIAELRKLGSNAAYCRSIYNRDNVPHTFARFDAWPELRALSRYFPGYSPSHECA